MCGLVGIYGHEYIAQDVYDGLMTLQHRGQDASGIVTFDGSSFHQQRGLGLVKDVFRMRHMKFLTGYAGIGHTRYATIGSGSPDEAQPFIGTSPYGVALAHNGNLFNSHELKEEIFEKDRRLVNSNSDAEVLLNLFTKNLSKNLNGDLKPENVWNAVESVFKRSKGAYSVVSYIARKGFVAFRDPHGIRPLLIGQKKNGLTTSYIFASESVTLDILGFECLGDVGAGEAVFVDEKERKLHRRQITNKKHIPCIFEYIYFARPDSMLNDVSVYYSRIRMGQKLAKQIKKADLKIDLVMPVPDSARTAALSIADALDLKYREGLVKNRYIGRTFIMPGQAVRKKSINYKLNPMSHVIKDKKILLVDDSIVRGNTSRKIVEMLRNAGAKKIYFASYSPPVISPCLYGIDIPTREELIASRNSIDEIRKFVGADRLFYQEIDDMFDACIKETEKLKDFCMACFDGKYKTGDIDEEVLKQVAIGRTNERACVRIEDTDNDDFGGGSDFYDESGMNRFDEDDYNLSVSQRNLV